MSNPPLIESFVTSATLEVRFMPGIDLRAASRLAEAMLAEVTGNGSYGAQAHVISRDDHLSISIENVEEREMTAAAYARTLGRLQEIARGHQRND